jgi:sterol 3beta-glucosyltransferase
MHLSIVAMGSRGDVQPYLAYVLGPKPLAASFYRNLDVSALPVVYGFSPILLPRPTDWGDWLQVSGHWFLDSQPGWQPPLHLLNFLEAGKPPVYIGFGSMVDEQIENATRIVLGALHKFGLRGILLGGWGGLGAGDLPQTVLMLDSVPHDWLFQYVSAVVHHGGASTTATGLRFGRPTMIVPFFADQPFWGERVHRLGAGPKPIPFARLSVGNLANAIDQAVNDPIVRLSAASVGEKLRNEDGVGKAVEYIRAFLDSQMRVS